MFSKKSFSEISINSEEFFFHRDYVSVNSEEKWAYDALKNVEISTVFSDIKLELTQTELVEERTTIKVSSVWLVR